MSSITRKTYILSFVYLAIKSTMTATTEVTPEIDAIRAVTSSLNQFAINLLQYTSNSVGEQYNLALAPYTVWSLMSIITEGAKENTASQLEEVLKIPPQNDRMTFRRSYKSLTKYLKQKADGVQLDISNAVFTTKEQDLNRTYHLLVKNFYDVEIMTVDFKNLIQAQNVINSHISKLTNNRINNMVTIDDLVDAQILLTSTMYFKGQWKIPFNKTATFKDKFYDEKGNEKGEVMMMYQMGSFPYTVLPNVKAHIVELPYGNGDRMSMFVILPRKREELSGILRKIASMPFRTILNAIEEAREYDDEVMVYLPRFVIHSDLILNAILYEMGIKDVFNEDLANLLGMFPHYLYLSRVIQQARIDVDEEGTEASAAAGGVLSFKSTPPRFYANKPFAFFIFDKETESIVFIGKVSNPSTICTKCLG